MLIYKRLNLVGIKIVYLTYLGSSRNALPQSHIQQAKLAIYRSLYSKVILPLADHSHIQTHIVQALSHLVNLHRTVKAVLLGTGLHKCQSV